MHLRPLHRVLAILIVGLGVLTAILLARGLVLPGLLGLAIIATVIAWQAPAARKRGTTQRPGPSSGAPRPASVPPDGHIRFTLAVEGLDPDRLAAVWSDLCRPDREPSDELRQLFRTFTVVEGRRFRFLKGDPTATATLLRDVLGAATGVSVRTRLEPAAERTAPWS